MRKVCAILFIALMVAVLSSCSNKERPISQKMTKQEEVNLLVNGYLDETITIFRDSMDAQKGFLGWRNVRDLLGLGKQSFSQRTCDTWDSVYDEQQMEYLIKLQLANKQLVLYLDKSHPEVGQYIHKISLSSVCLVLENIFEYMVAWLLGSVFASVSVFVYVFYQFASGKWKRWSSKRHVFVNSIAEKCVKLASMVAFTTAVILGIITADYSDDTLIEHIKSEVAHKIEMKLNVALKKNNIK